MAYPTHRMRRLRRHPGIRELVQEGGLSRRDLVVPLFIREGADDKPVGSMPGVSQWSLATLETEAKRMADEGVVAVLLFGIPKEKDSQGSSSWREDGIMQRSLETLHKAAPDLVSIVDVCFCEYTDHGHCGVMEDGVLHNDATLENLARQSVSLAQAGASCLAPSGMVDGMVSAIRDALDQADFPELPIMSYAAKFASSFYGPFRDAAESTPAYGDRRTHQMDVQNGEEALREVALDLEEGADMVMVKPGLPCLDVLRRVKDEFGVPTAAYQVSGEYSMILAAAEKGWIDRDAVMWESLHALKRGGADIIISYFAREVIGQL